ncbi:hypothetical protein NMG60_11029938 [Bertholletia excelsa]
MATFVDSKYDAAFCILLGSFCCLLRCYSMVVERARGESQSVSGSLQSLCWGSSAFGGIVSSYFSGSLVDAYGVRFVFGVTALLPLITSAVAVLVRETPVLGLARGHNLSLVSHGLFENSKQTFVELWNAVKQPNVFLPTIFIFLWQSTPHSDSAMFFFTNVLLIILNTSIFTHKQTWFHPEFLGRVKLVTSIASLLGVGIYNGSKKSCAQENFPCNNHSCVALGMTQVLLVIGFNRKLGISDEWFAIGDSLILTVLSQASFMPVLVLAAKLCPEGMEATLFATLMSITNAGVVVVGCLVPGYPSFGVTKESSLLPLPLLRLLPEDDSTPNSKGSGDIEMKSN